MECKSLVSVLKLINLSLFRDSHYPFKSIRRDRTETSANKTQKFIPGLCLIMLLMVISSDAFAATKSWQLPGGGSWTDGANWSGGTIPVTSDDIVINITGTGTITDVPGIYLNSISIGGSGNVTLTSAIGSTIVLANSDAVPAFNIDEGCTLNLGGGTSVSAVNILFLTITTPTTIAGTLTNNANNNIRIITSQILTVSGTFNTSAGTTTVFGTISNSGTITGGITNLFFNPLSSYIHNRNGGTIPTAEWNFLSSCDITAITDTPPLGLGQAFGNFSWNCPGQIGAIDLQGILTTVNGTLSVTETNNQELRLNSDAGSSTLTVKGDFLISGANTILNITGDVSPERVHIEGNFLMTGGSLTGSSSTPGLASISFIKAGTQIYFKTGGAISQYIDFTVLAGSSLDVGTSLIDGSSGTFSLDAGATLITANTEGISTSGATGSVQVTGARTFDPGAGYTYNGTSPQITGSGLPGSVNDLTISNLAGVTLSGDVTVVNNLVMVQGNIITGPYTLFLSNSLAGSLIYTSGAVVGNFKRSVSTILSTDYLFPVGTLVYARPASFNFSSLAATVDITAQFVATPPTGLIPYLDGALTIANLFPEGYWHFVSSAVPAASYAISLTGTGFTTYPINEGTRISGRDNSNSIWRAIGSPGTVTGSTVTRAGVTDLNTTSFDFAFGTICGVGSIPLIVGCPANIAVNADPGSCSAAVTWIEPVAADLCSDPGNLVWTKSHVPGTSFPVGTTTVTYTVQNQAGNSSAPCTFTITVSDDQPPLITAPAPVTVSSDATVCTASGVALGVPVTSDNCSVASITNNAPAIFPSGLTTVTWTVTDGAGNSASATQTVTVVDNVPPVAVCIGAYTVYLDISGNATITTAETDNGSTDNCGIASMSVFPNTFNSSNLGSNTVTLTVADLEGNISTCNTMVVVADNTFPVAVCKDITVQLGADGTVAITAASVDNGSHDSGGIASMAVTPAGFTCSDIGANAVVLSVTNILGKTATCNSTVTVVDNTNPTITCSSNITVFNDPGICDAVVDYPPSVALDNCSGAITTQIAGFDTGSNFPIGTTTNTFLVTDKSGNSATCSFTITVLNGSITLSSAAGTDAQTGCINTPVNNITYSTTGATGATVTGLPAGVTGVWAANVVTISGTPAASGIFSYVVTLEGSCGVVSASGAITVNPAPAISGIQTNVACFGGSSGAVNLTISGGSAPYTILWSNGATTEDLSALVEGTYTVTVTDINGCIANTSFTFTQPAQLTGNVSSKTNVLCFGSSSGSITIAGSGGTSPYEYSIDAGPYQPLGTFSDLDAGLHTISVRDANLCTFNVAVNITQPVTALTGSVVSQTYVSVPGGNDGSVTVAAAGGTSPYQYKLGAGAYQASGTFGSLMAGSYIVTIQDINLCTFDVPVTITQPTVLLAGSITSQTNVSCSGTPTGTVTVSATGGLAPYEYRIEAGSYQSSPTFGSLAAGNYTITIRDAALNTVEVNVTITGPSESLGVLLTTQTNILCFGTNTGSATVSGSGGTSPYQYKLSTGSFQVSGSFFSLTAGTYTITVQDANLCTSDVVVTITQPVADLTGTITDQTDVTCSGSDDGAITITAAGGTSPYEFSLNSESFQSSDIFGNLPASVYNITIRDANQCTTVVSATITAPVAIALDYTKEDAQCPGSTDGKISLIISGGRPPYRVIWSDNNTLLIRTNLPGGTYSVIVTDFNGCAASRNPVVGVIGSASCLEISEIITPNNDTYNDTWKIKNIDLFPDAEVFVYNRWGELVFRTKNIPANEWDGTFKGKLLPTDSYHYILHLNDGSEPRSGVISIIR